MEIIFQLNFHLLNNYLIIKEKIFSMNVINQLIAQSLNGLSTREKEDLAEKLGVSRKTLDNISNGKSTPDFDLVTKLGDELELDLLQQWKTANGRTTENKLEEKAPNYRVNKPMIKVGLSVNVDEKSAASINEFLAEIKFLCFKYGFTLD